MAAVNVTAEPVGKLPPHVALQLDPHLRAAERARQPIDQPAHAVLPRRKHLAPRQRDEPGGLPLEVVERDDRLAFRRAHVRLRQHAAEAFVAFG